ncbi:MAG: hypothetical protein ACRDHW_24080 [Ktedonobacteraceae bacterium]
MTQRNKALLRLMYGLEHACEEEMREAPALDVVQSTETVYRRFQILTRHREEEVATRQAEAAFADVRQRYPGQVRLLNRRALRELFAADGLIGYVITGEIEGVEAIIALPDGMCLGYGEVSSIPDQTARAAESG